jgi:phosphoglycolate/pyridoxal phosphate phosphatase family enzyme
MKEIDGFVFDLDGTVYLGEEALPGAINCLKELRRRRKRVVFVSNKPLEPARAYAEKLSRLGLPTSETEVITSAFVLGSYLSHNEPGLHLYVIGETNLIDELRSHGLTVVEEFKDQDSKEVIDPAGVDAVVVGFDRTLDYRKLNTAYQALRHGARFFSTNPDKVCPMPGGAIPDAGATIAALEAITNCKVELIAGKPSTMMMKVAMDRMELAPEQCMMVGDRLETDITMGQKAGMATAVVLTGVSKRTDIQKLTPPPDLVLEDLGELLNYLEE